MRERFGHFEDETARAGGALEVSVSFRPAAPAQLNLRRLDYGHEASSEIHGSAKLQQYKYCDFATIYNRIVYIYEYEYISHKEGHKYFSKVKSRKTTLLLLYCNYAVTHAFNLSHRFRPGISKCHLRALKCMDE